MMGGGGGGDSEDAVLVLQYPPLVQIGVWGWDAY